MAGRTHVHTVKKVKDMVDLFKSFGHLDTDTARIYDDGSSETLLGNLKPPT